MSSTIKRETIKQEDLPSSFTVEVAAKYLGIGRTLAYELVRRGVIPSHRLGKLYRIPREPFLRWQDNCGKEEAAGAGGQEAASDVGGTREHLRRV